MISFTKGKKVNKYEVWTRTSWQHTCSMLIHHTIIFHLTTEKEFVLKMCNNRLNLSASVKVKVGCMGACLCVNVTKAHTHTDAQTNKLTYRHTPFFHKLKKLLKGLKDLFNPISNSILIDTSHLNTPPFSSRHISKSNLTTLKKVSIICMICPHIRICRPSLF